MWARTGGSHHNNLPHFACSSLFLQSPGAPTIPPGVVIPVTMTAKADGAGPTYATQTLQVTEPDKTTVHEVVCSAWGDPRYT